MDPEGRTLLRKVTELLAARQDDDWNTLRRAIHRGPSWISEFQHGKRTTNDLRLVLRMARFFGVSPGYLFELGGEPASDVQLATLIGAWKELHPRDKRAVLRLALTLCRTDAADGPESV